MSAKTEATIEDLHRVEGKAELINGEIIPMSPTGRRPFYAAREIFLSLLEYEKRTRRGYAITDGAGFAVDLPNRKSFCPDAAFYVGDLNSMKFFEGAPIFAVDVRSEGDYCARAEREIEKKRADYFAAGALVVWDVDLLSETPVRVYRASAPDVPTVYHRGNMAEAEPAVPDWTMPVDDLFMRE